MKKRKTKISRMNPLRIGRRVQQDIAFGIRTGHIIKVIDKQTNEILVKWQDGDITSEVLGGTILYNA